MRREMPDSNLLTYQELLYCGEKLSEPERKILLFSQGYNLLRVVRVRQKHRWYVPSGLFQYRMPIETIQAGREKLPYVISPVSLDFHGRRGRVVLALGNINPEKYISEVDPIAVGLMTEEGFMQAFNSGLDTFFRQYHSAMRINLHTRQRVKTNRAFWHKWFQEDHSDLSLNPLYK